MVVFVLFGYLFQCMLQQGRDKKSADRLFKHPELGVLN